MRLATVADLVSFMGVVDNEGSRGNAAIILDVSSGAVAEHIGTALVYQSYVEYFSHHPSRLARTYQPVGYRLSAGFIDADTLVVRRSTDAGRVAADNYETVSSDDYILDAERGVLTMLKQPPIGTETIRVAYSAGFETVSDSGGKVLKGHPDWLRNAGILAATKVMQMNPSNFVARKSLIMLDVHKAFRGEVSALLNPHIRPRMGMYWPTRTAVSE